MFRRSFHSTFVTSRYSKINLFSKKNISRKNTRTQNTQAQSKVSKAKKSKVPKEAKHNTQDWNNHTIE